MPNGNPSVLNAHAFGGSMPKVFSLGDFPVSIGTPPTAIIAIYKNVSVTLMQSLTGDVATISLDVVALNRQFTQPAPVGTVTFQHSSVGTPFTWHLGPGLLAFGCHTNDSRIDAIPANGLYAVNNPTNNDVTFSFNGGTAFPCT
jgi:hypothetical protein